MSFYFAKKQRTKGLTDMTYKEAITEIEAILRSLREEQNSVDTLAERVARATELIAHCRAKLRKAEEDVNTIIGN
jgi:exodeoxyribonuclease VII small subunit